MPRPRMTSTLRRLSSPDRPPTKRSTIPVVRSATRSQSAVKAAGAPRGHDPELGRVVRGAVHLRRVQQRLRGDAAAVEAGAADRVVLHKGHAQPRGGTVQRGRVSAGSTADDHDVVVVMLVATRRSVSITSAVCGTTASSRAGLVGRRGVLGGDPDHRVIQRPEALLAHDRGDLRPVAQPHGGLVEHHGSRGLVHGRDDGLDVQRHQAADVDDLHRDALLLQLGRGLQTLVDADRVGDEGDVGALADHPRLTDRDRIQRERARAFIGGRGTCSPGRAPGCCL